MGNAVIFSQEACSQPGEKTAEPEFRQLGVRILPDEDSHLKVVESQDTEDVNSTKEEMLADAYLQVVQKMIDEAMKGNFQVAKFLYPDMPMKAVQAAEDFWTLLNKDSKDDWECEKCRISEIPG